MFVYIASDHSGFELKKLLLQKYNFYNKSNFFIDCGCYTTQSVDYPDFSTNVSKKIIQDNKQGINSFGILICGTGIGMSIAANKFHNIRAALINSIFTAEMAKKHNNANIICLGAKIIDFDTAVTLINKFMDTEFEAERHERRLNKILIQTQIDKQL
jgi:ribose 5-phosphate isomerase B